MAPKKADPALKGASLRTLVTDAEAKAIEAAAAAEQRSVSAWIRRTLCAALGLK